MKKYLFPLIASIALVGLAGVAIGCSSNSTSTDEGGGGGNSNMPKATSFTLSKTSMTLKAPANGVYDYDNLSCEATIPENASKEVKFSVDPAGKSGVVTVDSEGKVTALGGGDATIIVKHVDLPEEKDWKYCEVKVVVPVESINLSKGNFEMALGDAPVVIIADVRPISADFDDVKWDSTNKSAATAVGRIRLVDEVPVYECVITAVNIGETEITATAGGMTNRITVTVTEAPPAPNYPVTAVEIVEVSKKTVTLGIGEKMTLSAKVLSNIPPDYLASDQRVVWKSSNTDLATVDPDTGVVTGVGKGIDVGEESEDPHVTITVTTLGSTTTNLGGEIVQYDDVCTVVVKNYPVTAISLNKPELTMLVNGSEALSVFIQPYNATNKDVIWTSSDPSVATVSDSGLIKAIKRGTSDITVKSKFSETIAARCTVMVQSIFVAGYEGNPGTPVAKLWIDGGENFAAGNAMANAVFVQGDDIYLAGYETISGRRAATLWGKDGYSVPLSSSGPCEAVSVYVSEIGGKQDVYVAGFEEDASGKAVAAVWHGDDIPWYLSRVNGDARANSIFVSGGVVYSAGHETNDDFSYAMVWKNREPFTLNGGFTASSASARSIFVVGSDIYVAGWKKDADAEGGYIAVVWINGRETELGHGMANSIHVAGNGQIYVAGYRVNSQKISVASLWTGTKAADNAYSNSHRPLADGGTRSVANSVGLLGNEYYVVGYETNQDEEQVAMVWKDRFAEPIGAAPGEAKGIVIR
ncbi:MAG: Ig-like domain-containing protein [Holophagaceae bacterium]|nr:Ig-like domain-containing protein [Holophagaceae bacterium]